MSTTSGIFTTTYINPFTTYTMDLNASNGDLIQRYTGTVANPGFPLGYDWSLQNNHPVIPVGLRSSDPDETASVIAGKIVDTQWYLNDKQITFNSAGESLNITNGPQIAGCFKKLAPNTTNGALYPCGGLQIINNLVTALSGVNATLRCEVLIDRGSESETHQHTTTISFSKIVDGATVADIYCDSNQTFNLDASHSSVVCKARLLEGATVIANNTKVMSWFLYDSSVADWVWKATAETFTVTDEMVNSYQTVMVAYYDSGTSSADAKIPSKAIATDTKVISDITDSLVLFANPTPQDGVLRATDPTATGVTFAPKVRDRDTNKEITGLKYKFTCLSPSGTILNGSPSLTPGANGGFDVNNNGTADNTELLTTYTVPRAMFEAINAGPTVVITAFQST